MAKKVLLALLCFLTIYSCEMLAGTSAMVGKTRTKSNNPVKIGWEFVHYWPDDDEMPMTDISIIATLDGKETKVKLGSYAGQFGMLTADYYKWWHIPKNAIIACMSVWAGVGNVLYVTKKNDNTLSVMWKKMFLNEEGTGRGPIAKTPEHKKIQQIKIRETKTIEVSPPTEIDNEK